MNSMRLIVFAISILLVSTPVFPVANGIRIRDTRGRTVRLPEIPAKATIDQLREGLAKRYGMKNVDFYDVKGNFILRDAGLDTYAGKVLMIRTPFVGVPQEASTLDMVF